MSTGFASLQRKQATECCGLSFFDLPSAIYPALVEGMADEHRWHFEKNNTETHMAFLKEWGPRLVEWATHLPFPKGSVHLDLGAGEGILSYLVAQSGYHSIAVELCATILHSASLFRSGLHGPHSSMDLWVGDIYHLPLEAGSVDFVTIKQVLHHLHDLDGLMQEVSRVLKPDGVVYIWEPFFVSIPLLRGYVLKRTRSREVPLGIRHVYHTYGTYKRLCQEWLTDLTIEREFIRAHLHDRIVRNRFTNGAIYAHGHIKPYRPSTSTPSERIQIQPKDFLREEWLDEGLRTTRCRKEFLDSLLSRARS